MLQVNQQNLTQAVHDISQGGVWQAAIEMLAGDRNWPFVGLEINCPDSINETAFLFSANGGYLCEVLPKDLDTCLSEFQHHGVFAQSIGITNTSKEVVVKNQAGIFIQVSLEEVLKEFNAKNLVTPGTPIYNDYL